MEEKFPMVSLIHDARAFLGLSIEEVQRILGPAAKPEPGDDYQKLDNVTSVENLRIFPGTIYLKENMVAAGVRGPDLPRSRPLHPVTDWTDPCPPIHTPGALE